MGHKRLPPAGHESWLTRHLIAERFSLPLTRVVYLAELGYFGSAMQGTRASLWYDPESVKLGIERAKDRGEKGQTAVSVVRQHPQALIIDVESELAEPTRPEVEDKIVRGAWQESLEVGGDVVKLLMPHIGGDAERANLAFANWSRRRAADAVDDLISFRPALTERALAGDVSAIEAATTLAFSMKPEEAARAAKSWLDSPSGLMTRLLHEKALAQKEIDRREMESYEKYVGGESLREHEKAQREMRRMWRDMDRESAKANEEARKSNEAARQAEVERQALRVKRRADRESKRGGGGSGGGGGAAGIGGAVKSFGWLLGTLKEAWEEK
jgi:hypothetical protein